jgi:hypothetical protein
LRRPTRLIDLPGERGRPERSAISQSCVDDGLCWRVALQAAQRRGRHPPVGGECAVLVKDIEQEELGPCFGFLARHVTLPLLMLGSLETPPSREGVSRKLALLGHALEGFGFALDTVQELAGFHREQPNHLVLTTRRRPA